MKNQLKTFVVRTMPIPLEGAKGLITDFIRDNRNVTEYAHLFENENKINQKVTEFLKDEGKIVRPCSFYVYSDGIRNSSLFVADEKGTCRLVGDTKNILPQNVEMVTALAVSKSVLRIENPPRHLGEVTDFSIKGYIDENQSIVKKNILISGFWEYNKQTNEIMFPENQYIESGKIYNILITYERDEFPQEFLWLRKFSLGI
ncbi:hypothetical protein [Capnocytophaga cynodegmi]|uniref:Uncharacterized protein n=1 Tax=Capnocytophaga cynodegmi TaxID=28189 RepID=A0A0B7HB81_9FLAO|nr:hypothetical protein [Capnocytophaga cynodegmi]CEN34873.1 hypothetical protein CCYN2B_240007 [Capnocytophaga cynodegmi]